MEAIISQLSFYFTELIEPVLVN